MSVISYTKEEKQEKDYAIYELVDGKVESVEGEHQYAKIQQRKDKKLRQDAHYNQSCDEVKDSPPLFKNNPEISSLRKKLGNYEFENNFILLRKNANNIDVIRKELKRKFNKITLVEPFPDLQHKRKDKAVLHISANASKD